MERGGESGKFIFSGRRLKTALLPKSQLPISLPLNRKPQNTPPTAYHQFKMSLIGATIEQIHEAFAAYAAEGNDEEFLLQEVAKFLSVQKMKDIVKMNGYKISGSKGMKKEDYSKHFVRLYLNPPEKSEKMPESAEEFNEVFLSHVKEGWTTDALAEKATKILTIQKAKNLLQHNEVNYKAKKTWKKADYIDLLMDFYMQDQIAEAEEVEAEEEVEEEVEEEPQVVVDPNVILKDKILFGLKTRGEKSLTKYTLAVLMEIFDLKAGLKAQLIEKIKEGFEDGTYKMSEFAEGKEKLPTEKEYQEHFARIVDEEDAEMEDAEVEEQDEN